MKQLIPVEFENVEDYEDYAYPMGRIKSIENRLITKKRMIEFAGVKNLSDLLKGLEDTDYEPYLLRAKTIAEREQAMEKALVDSVNEIDSMMPENKKWVVELFRIKYDLSNLKMLFKIKFANSKKTPHFSPLGIIPIKKLTEALSIPLEDIPKYFAGYYGFLDKALNNYKKLKDGRIFDFILEKEIFKIIFNKIPKTREGNFLRNYFMIEVDLVNIISYLRIKRDEKGKLFIHTLCFIEGGTLTIDQIWNLKLETTPYSEVWKEAKDEYEETGSLTKFERLSHNFLIRFVHDQAILKNLDPETVYHYLIKKEQEVQDISMLIGLKTKNAPIWLAQKMIGETYA